MPASKNRSFQPDAGPVAVGALKHDRFRAAGVILGLFSAPDIDIVEYGAVARRAHGDAPLPAKSYAHVRIFRTGRKQQ